jgi:sulfite oxidase
MTEVSTFSGITHSNVVSEAKAKPGNTVTMKAEGWAWAGGGRNIVRVDVTGDGGKSWATAEVDGRKSTTIWSFLGVGILGMRRPAVVAEDGTVQLAQSC